MKKLEFGDLKVMSFQEYLEENDLAIDENCNTLDSLTEEEYALFKATY